MTAKSRKNKVWAHITKRNPHNIERIALDWQMEHSRQIAGIAEEETDLRSVKYR